MPRVIVIHKILLLFLIAAITAVFFRSQGTNDMNTWLTWASHAYELGVVESYARDGNLYPPLAFILLWLCHHAAILLGIAPVYLIKFSFLVFLLATTALFYHWSHKSLIATLCFYSAMLLSSLGLGYLDIYFAPAILFALMALQKNKITLFALFFTTACLIKFPPLLIAPFFIIYLLANNTRSSHKFSDFKNLCFKTALPCCVLLLPILFFFGKTLIIALLKTANAGWLSACALNFNWVITRIYLQQGWAEAFPGYETTVAMIRVIPPTVAVLAKGLTLFFFSSTFIAFLLRPKTFENLLLFSLLGSFSYFMFYTGVHENHLFLASLLAMALFCVNSKNVYLSFGILLISSMNMFLFYGVSGSNGVFLFHSDMTVLPYSYWTDAPLLLAIVNTLYFLILWSATAGSDLLTFVVAFHRNKKAPQ